MEINEILTRGWHSREAISALTDRVEAILMNAGETLSTTKLIEALVPNVTDSRFKALTGLLWTLRQRNDTKAFWAYTGRKTSFGKQALHWLPQVTARPKETAIVDLDDAEIERLQQEQWEQAKAICLAQGHIYAAWGICNRCGHMKGKP
jgi:hypothetical protein